MYVKSWVLVYAWPCASAPQGLKRLLRCSNKRPMAKTKARRLKHRPFGCGPALPSAAPGQSLHSASPSPPAGLSQHRICQSFATPDGANIYETE
eukprot:scaffold625312_cov43-Prasinocladus_malaysianus.AAC.1